jgi:hypothetical protein
MSDIEFAIVAALLRHAEYSFAPIGWDYNQLTDAEKGLISSDEFGAIKTLMVLKEMSERTDG